MKGITISKVEVGGITTTKIDIGDELIELLKALLRLEGRLKDENAAD